MGLAFPRMSKGFAQHGPPPRPRGHRTWGFPTAGPALAPCKSRLSRRHTRHPPPGGSAAPPASGYSTLTAAGLQLGDTLGSALARCCCWAFPGRSGRSVGHRPACHRLGSGCEHAGRRPPGARGLGSGLSVLRGRLGPDLRPRGVEGPLGAVEPPRDLGATPRGVSARGSGGSWAFPADIYPF